jgi:hypothetical protein
MFIEVTFCITDISEHLVLFFYYRTLLILFSPYSILIYTAATLTQDSSLSINSSLCFTRKRTRDFFFDFLGSHILTQNSKTPQKNLVVRTSCECIW